MSTPKIRLDNKIKIDVNQSTRRLALHPLKHDAQDESLKDTNKSAKHLKDEIFKFPI